MSKRSLIWTVLILFAIGVISYCGWAYTLVDSRPDKMWMHRCNSMEKIEELGERYPNFEVDVYLRSNGTLDITHENDITFGLTIGPYFEYLSKNEKRHMWIDVKNLTDENQGILIHSLDSLGLLYGISPDRLVVESRRWDLLKPLTQKGYTTAYHINYERGSHNKAMSDSLHKVVNSGSVKALSFPNDWYSFLKEEFGKEEVELVTWFSHRTQWTFFLSPRNRKLLNDPQLKIILIKEYGHHHR